MGHFFHGCHTCPNCKGKGKAKYGGDSTTTFCGGTRVSPVVESWCHKCKGCGRVEGSVVKCGSCEGKGKRYSGGYTSERQVEVRAATRYPDGSVKRPAKYKTKKVKVPRTSSKCSRCDGRGKYLNVTGPCSR